MTLRFKKRMGTLLPRISEGLWAAWPICLGYGAIGLAFGVIAQKSGLSPLEIGVMSLLVFAGSSQFIAVSMLATGAGALPILLTTFTVNLRHVLMSSSLALYLGNVNGKYVSLFAYGVTDESFAVNMTRFREGNWDWKRALVVNHTANIAWILSTVAGGYGGEFIPAGAFGIDYALVAMFICLLVFQLREAIHVVVSILAGILAVFFSLLLPGNFYIVIASVIAATAGLFLARSTNLRKIFQKGESNQ